MAIEDRHSESTETEERLRTYLKRVTVDLAEARRRVGELEESAQEPIAVVGMACRYPGGGHTVEGFWDLLRDGRTGVVEIPPQRWDVDAYYDPDRTAPGGMYTRHGSFLDDIAGWDAELFGISPQEALRTDPQQRLLMELVWEGLEDAGISPDRAAGSRTAVMVGFMDTIQYARVQTERSGPAVQNDPYFGLGVAASVVAGRLAYQYDFRGPAVTLDTACSSSLVGAHLAAQALRRGECDLAVAAGAFLIMAPDTFVQACTTSMLAADGRCKTFDRTADGYVMGEGGGLVVLERLSSALSNGHRVRAVLRGSAVNQDGRSNGLTAPSRRAQVDVIRRAQAAAGVTPDDVDFVEAHGTGTALGDAIELSALHDVFGGRPAGRPLHLGAVKTLIGHTQAAAGVAGLIKTVLSLEHGELTGNLHLAQPSDALPADGSVQPLTGPVHLPTGGRRAVAGVSAFGWSGTNAHLVVSTAPEVPAGRDGDSGRGPWVLPVSAATAGALPAQLSRLAARLRQQPTTVLSDVVHTLAVGRAQLDVRRAVVCASGADAADELDRAAAISGAPRVTGRPRVAFLLPGVGDQYPGMGRDLYLSEPVFAAAVDACVELTRSRGGIDLRPLLLATPPSGEEAGWLAPATEADPLDRAEVAHPYVFAVEYALATLLRSWGVVPDVLVGYSLGEYVAGCLAGVLSLEDAVAVVVERARLVASAPAGAMAAVAADEATVRAAIERTGADVDVAALNGPSMTVVSGLPAGVDALTRRLVTDGVACRPLRTTSAFHSSLLEPARDKLAALLAQVDLRPPTTPVLSNRTGAPLSAEQATDPEHWADHLVSPVRFADQVRQCLGDGVDVFVEIGPGQTLGGLVRQHRAGTGAEVLGTLPARWSAASRPDARAELLRTCGRLWERGVPVDWPATCEPGARLVGLPTYPFQRVAYWPELTAAASRPVRPAAAGPADLTYVHTWRPDPDRTAPPALCLPGPLVVLSDGDGVGQLLADLAEAAGGTVVEVVPGRALRRDGRRVVVDPREPGHYREAVAGLAGQGPVTVAHLWSLRATSEQPVVATDAELGDAVAHGFDSLLRAAQALGSLPGSDGVRLLTASRGAFEVVGADATAPYQALGHGLARVLQHEYAGLTWSGTDLDPDDGDAVTACAALARELLEPAGPHGRVTAWRHGRRWLPDWDELSEPAGDQPVWRPDGVYLLTGGTRGLGLSLARHLVRSGVRRLALVGRTAPAAGRLGAVAELEAAGAEVLLLSADAGDPAQLRAALRRCRQHFGTLTGVVHAAGVAAGGMAAGLCLDTAHRVLAPKVLAMGPLGELVGPATPPDERPELLVLYSSAITSFGGIGEGDYCAANTLLDAYGTALAAAAPDTRVVSVAWGPWQHDAWQEGHAHGVGGGLAERAGAYRARYGFTDEAGCELLDRVLRTGHGSVVAVRQPLQDSLAEWSALLDIDALAGGATGAPGERFARPQLRTAFVAPRDAQERIVADVWGAFLGIDQVGVHDPFFDLGGNSLVGMAMVHAVEKALGTSIAPAVLFEHPTVAEFAAATATNGAPPSTPALGASTARGQRRRSARPGSRGEARP